MFLPSHFLEWLLLILVTATTMAMDMDMAMVMVTAMDTMDIMARERLRLKL